MSRSYRKEPVCNARSIPAVKKWASRRARRKKMALINTSKAGFKRVFDSTDIVEKRKREYNICAWIQDELDGKWATEFEMKEYKNKYNRVFKRK